MTFPVRRSLLAIALASSFASLAARADDSAPAEAQAAPLPWQPGPLTASIGSDLAEIELPEGYMYLDRPGTLDLLTRTGNITGESELATVAKGDQSDWFVIFEWDAMGWVDDSDRADLDADELLASLKEGNAAANEERESRGWSTLELVGWHEPPHYDAATNNLTWAIKAQSEGHLVLNRMVKLLGRRGVMSATLVASPEELPAAQAEVDQLLAGYRFRSGNTYAEYIPGKDTAAKIGLGALVVGGGAAALAKTGLLAKLWKPIAAGVIALGAAIKRLFGGRSQSPA